MIELRQGPKNVRLRHAALPVLVLGVLLALLLPGRAEAATCATSGPTGGAYTVTVCISAPADAAFVSGPVPVTATVTTAGTSPGVQRLSFKLGGEHLLTDYAAPFTFTLSSARFVDGLRTLEVSALMRDAFVSSPAPVALTFQNGITSPPVNTNTFTPRSGTTPAPGRPF